MVYLDTVYNTMYKATVYFTVNKVHSCLCWLGWAISSNRPSTFVPNYTSYIRVKN